MIEVKAGVLSDVYIVLEKGIKMNTMIEMEISLKTHLTHFS